MAAGSDEWRHWLDAQLAKKVQQSTAVEDNNDSTKSGTGAVSNPGPPPFQANNDYGVGSKKHAIWLDRQLQNVAPQPSSLGHQPQPPPRQPATGSIGGYNLDLPAAVNALNRGQDLSAVSHHDWLSQQFQLAQSEPPPQRSVAAKLAAPERGAEPPSSARTDDIALGSTAHSAWLDQQLRGRR